MQITREIQYKLLNPSQWRVANGGQCSVRTECSSSWPDLGTGNRRALPRMAQSPCYCYLICLLSWSCCASNVHGGGCKIWRRNYGWRDTMRAWSSDEGTIYSINNLHMRKWGGCKAFQVPGVLPRTPEAADTFWCDWKRGDKPRCVSERDEESLIHRKSSPRRSSVSKKSMVFGFNSVRIESLMCFYQQAHSKFEGVNILCKERFTSNVEGSFAN